MQAVGLNAYAAARMRLSSPSALDGKVKLLRVARTLEAAPLQKYKLLCTHTVGLVLVRPFEAVNDNLVIVLAEARRDNRSAELRRNYGVVNRGVLTLTSRTRLKLPIPRSIHTFR